MQHYAANVLKKCVHQGSNKGSLTCSNNQPLTFEIISHNRGIKSSALPESRAKWIRRQVDQVSAILRVMPNYKQNVDAVIRALSKKYGYTVLLKDKDTLLNSYQCVALRDHM